MRQDDDSGHDCDRIVALAKLKGFQLSRLGAEAIWEHHSDEWSASWLLLPKDDGELWRYVGPYLEGHADAS